MSWFHRCKHEHVVIAKTYWEGCRGGLSIDIFSGTVRPLVIQETTVLIRCEKCGSVERHVMNGKELNE